MPSQIQLPENKRLSLDLGDVNRLVDMIKHIKTLTLFPWSSVFDLQVYLPPLWAPLDIEETMSGHYYKQSMAVLRQEV